MTGRIRALLGIALALACLTPGLSQADGGPDEATWYLRGAAVPEFIVTAACFKADHGGEEVCETFLSKQLIVPPGKVTNAGGGSVVVEAHFPDGEVETFKLNGIGTLTIARNLGEVGVTSASYAKVRYVHRGDGTPRFQVVANTIKAASEGTRYKLALGVLGDEVLAVRAGAVAVGWRYRASGETNLRPGDAILINADARRSRSPSVIKGRCKIRRAMRRLKRDNTPRPSTRAIGAEELLERARAALSTSSIDDAYDAVSEAYQYASHEPEIPYYLFLLWQRAQEQGRTEIAVEVEQAFSQPKLALSEWGEIIRSATPGRP